ncbi:MAG: transposase [Thermodesulfobacteriota bacterium]|nr:transposase [Thermodesulfobacteriota bacterium]
MPRQPRLDAPGALHHVMGRGIDGIKIFRNKKDREDFLKRLADLCIADALSVYAWALMSDHFHLLVRTGNKMLSNNMRKLLTGYVVNYNRRHKRYGHLFQNRYKSILCEDDPYLLELTRYIHLNPLRAGIVKDLNELKECQWCGHSGITGRVKREWQDTDAVLAYFGKKRKRAIEKYEDFVAEGIESGSRPELVGGGLIRSLGGWSQVLSLRRSGSKVFSDERILGSSEFVNNIIIDVEEKAKETLRLNLRRSDLPSLSREICKGEGIDEAELRSGSRKRNVVKSRRIFSQIAVKKMGYSGADVARFLGINTSAVNRLAVSDELPGIEKYL